MVENRNNFGFVINGQADKVEQNKRRGEAIPHDDGLTPQSHRLIAVLRGRLDDLGRTGGGYPFWIT